MFGQVLASSADKSSGIGGAILLGLAIWFLFPKNKGRK